MRKQAPRLLIAGTGSGCGKTTVVCAVLQALKNRGEETAAFKCGPDYIDPMFHSEIIGTPCINIDLYFAGEMHAKSLFVRHARALNIIEGVMGYYDGLSMDSAAASGWDVARILGTPVVLVVNARGMAALSVSAVVKGFQNLRTPSGIVGVILNQVSAMSYVRMKAVIEQECGIHVWGFLPVDEEFGLESRHLGLIAAQEVTNLKKKMQSLSEQAEKSLDLDGLIALMRTAAPVDAQELRTDRVADVRIAVARDKGFCFYYQDNLELLQDMGARLVFFSPLEDQSLPPCDGLILGGGYPELYARQLAQNTVMRREIAQAVLGGLPTIAECGGFMYLTRSVEGEEMTGVIPTDCHRMKKMTRFGYVELTAESDSMLFEAGDTIRAHEFHYWDATDSGSSMMARKQGGRSWSCVFTGETLYAGFPHLYFYSNMKSAERFIRKCYERKMRHETDGD